MDKITEALQATILAQISADPGLPRPNPTTAFWQLPPHSDLAAIQSPTLPTETDFAIIGSGVTGCSAAKNLLEHTSFPRNGKVTVLEARELCSGATGRNGGALTSPIPHDFVHLSTVFGEIEAIKIGRYAFRTLEKMHTLGNGSPQLKTASEVRRLRDVVGFADRASFEKAKISYQKYAELVPDCDLHYEILTAEQALKSHNMKNIVGAIVFDSGAFWPYRLITQIWADLLAEWKPRLTIESRTPVTDVSYCLDDATKPYVLTTPRGTVRAKTVIYATNAFTGHLLSQLRGKMFPLRGTMSTQLGPSAFGAHGHEKMWTISHTPRFNESTGIFETGLYYSNQNPKTSDIFIGGEYVRADEIIVSDDSTISTESEDNITKVLPRYFDSGWGLEQKAETRRIWSGIMAFTSDGVPLIGKLPARGPTRADSDGGEWLAVAWNGYGMPQCWSGGEAVARMICCEDVSDWLPSTFLCTEERLQRLSARSSLEHLGNVFGA